MVQVSIKKERRGSVKQRRFGSNVKSTPKRGNSEADERSSTNQVKDYETPSMKKYQTANIEAVSPFNTNM